MTNEIETTWTARLLKTDIPHIVRGVVYEPCTTGHSCQLDSQQDWITPDELRKAAWNFMKTSLLKKGHTIGNQHKGEVALAKAEIMTMAIEASRTAVMMEREYCAKLVDTMADDEEEGETCTAIRAVAEAIRNRIPSQRPQ